MVSRHRASLAALSFVTAALLAACGGRPAGAPQSSPSVARLNRAAQVWTQLTECMRTHGYPNWPDAVIDDSGRGSYPEVVGLDEKAAIDALQATCGHILDQLPPEAQPHQQQVTAAQMATLLQFARCMREHGEADWPDPRPDGGFPLSVDAQQRIGAVGVPTVCRALYSGSIAVDQP
jgi:hypothetical protein